MATTGTFTFNPEFAQHIDEAFERCLIDPADITARHLRSVTRSANLVLTDWANYGYKEHTLEFVSQPLTTGQQSFQLPVGGYDIFHATLKRDGRESEMYPISRSDYNSLHDKTLQGRPDRYFVDRGEFVQDDQRSRVYLWQAPENDTDTIELWYMRRHEDVGNMQNTLDIAPAFQEAFAAGLAFHLSKKFAVAETKRLRDDYLGEGFSEFANSVPGGALGRALGQDRDSSDLVMRVRFDRYRGRR